MNDLIFITLKSIKVNKYRKKDNKKNPFLIKVHIIIFEDLSPTNLNWIMKYSVSEISPQLVLNFMQGSRCYSK